MSVNYKAKEILIEVAKTGAVEVVKSMVPFSGFLGTCFDIRSSIVQQRLNNFTNSFLSYIDELGIQVDEGTLTSETFNDLYISILERVSKTNCEHKLNIFREILAYNIPNSYQSDFRETFLDLVNKLDYIEIEILQMFKNTGRFGSLDITENLVGAVSSIKSISCEEDIKRIIRDKFPSLSAIEVEGKYEFYICDLTSKSLLIATNEIGKTWMDVGEKGPTMIYMTDFGKEFLRYIQIGI